MSTVEFLPVPLTSLTLRPGDMRLPEPMELSLELDGDLISRAKVKTGFTVRGIEKRIQSMPLLQGTLYASLVDPETSLFYQSAYFGALEHLAKIEISEGDRYCRRVLMQWSALAHYLRKLGEAARSIGVEPAYYYATRDREILLETLEWFTGHRFGYFAFQMGGVKSPLSKGMVERALEILSALSPRVEEYRAFLSEQHGVRARLSGVGILSSHYFQEYEIGGEKMRAIAASKQYLDAFQRVCIWVQELQEGILNLKTTLQNGVPEFSISNERIGSVPKGEALYRQEGPRGTVGVSLILEESNQISSVQFLSPSDHILAALPEALTGVRLEDLEIVLRLFDFSIREVDR